MARTNAEGESKGAEQGLPFDPGEVQLIDMVRVGANGKAFLTKEVLRALEAEEEDTRIGFWRLPDGQIVAKRIDYVF